MRSNGRILEPEGMMTVEEVFAYDRLTLKYLKILHAGFAETVINLSPDYGKFLEVGTGTGRIAIEVAKHNANISISAVDLSESMLVVARRNAGQEGVLGRVVLSIADAKRLPFANGTFDAAFCHNMLHHIPDPLPVLREMNRVVKSGGAIIVRDLVRVHPFLVPLHVNVFGLPYDRLMKKEYTDSIKAAFSREEWLHLSRDSGISGARTTRQFITHQGIEKPSDNRRREYFNIPVHVFLRPFKKMYVSNVRMI